jgi:hypothetical protein
MFCWCRKLLLQGQLKLMEEVSALFNNWKIKSLILLQPSSQLSMSTACEFVGG